MYESALVLRTGADSGWLPLDRMDHRQRRALPRFVGPAPELVLVDRSRYVLFYWDEGRQAPSYDPVVNVDRRGSPSIRAHLSRLVYCTPEAWSSLRVTSHESTKELDEFTVLADAVIHKAESLLQRHVVSSLQASLGCNNDDHTDRVGRRYHYDFYETSATTNMYVMHMDMIIGWGADTRLLAMGLSHRSDCIH